MPVGPKDIGMGDEEYINRLVKFIDSALMSQKAGERVYVLNLPTAGMYYSERVKNIIIKLYKKAGWSEVEFDFSIRSQPLLILKLNVNGVIKSIE